MEGIKDGIIVDGTIYAPVSAEHKKGNLCLQCSLKKHCDTYYWFNSVCIHFEKKLGKAVIFQKVTKDICQEVYQEMANLKCETAIKASFSKTKKVNNRFKRYFESLKKLIKN